MIANSKTGLKLWYGITVCLVYTSAYLISSTWNNVQITKTQKLMNNVRTTFEQRSLKTYWSVWQRNLSCVTSVTMCDNFKAKFAVRNKRFYTDWKISRPPSWEQHYYYLFAPLLLSEYVTKWITLSCKPCVTTLVFPLDTVTLPLETSKFWRRDFVSKLAGCRAQLRSIVYEWIICLYYRKNITEILKRNRWII